MHRIFLPIYRLLFGRKMFYRFNRFLYCLSMRGMGIMNFENDNVSGEQNFTNTFFKDNSPKTVFDVGANVGDYSRKILGCADKVRVYAFEPHPITFNKLKTSIQNANFSCHNLAVGREGGEIELYDYADNDSSTHASVYKDVIEKFRNSKAVAHKVKLVTLSDFAKRNGIDSVDLLKIDTEGNELDVIKGFSEYIQSGKVRAIQFEFNDTHVISRVFFKDFWDALPNYNFYRMLPDGLVPIKTYDPISCEIFAFQNIVALLGN